MKKYHVKTGDGKGYYGVGYESYRQAESVLKISQMHDPQAHIVEEEYYFTNADRIRAMSDEDLATHLYDIGWDCHLCAEHRRLDNQPLLRGEKCDEKCVEHCLEWLKQPAEGDVNNV